MRKNVAWGLGGLAVAAAATAYLFIGIDLAPHQEYVEEAVDRKSVV